jgi:hypothetical protein
LNSATRLASVAFTLVLALGLAVTPALKGQDAVTASPTAATTVVPPLIRFTGVIALPGTPNPTSSTASAGLVTATFSLYQFQEGGAPLWSETQKVQLDEQGNYVVLLGAVVGKALELLPMGTGVIQVLVTLQ